MSNCQNCTTCGRGDFGVQRCDGAGSTDLPMANCRACTTCSVGEYGVIQCDGSQTFDVPMVGCTACNSSCAVGTYLDGLCDGSGESDTQSCQPCADLFRLAGGNSSGFCGACIEGYIGEVAPSRQACEPMAVSPSPSPASPIQDDVIDNITCGQEGTCDCGICRCEELENVTTVITVAEARRLLEDSDDVLVLGGVLLTELPSSLDESLLLTFNTFSPETGAACYPDSPYEVIAIVIVDPGTGEEVDFVESDEPFVFWLRAESPFDEIEEICSPTGRVIKPEKPKCMWYDENMEAWTTSGCIEVTGVLVDSEEAGSALETVEPGWYLECACNHLTEFAVIASLQEVTTASCPLEQKEVFLVYSALYALLALYSMWASAIMVRGLLRLSRGSSEKHKNRRRPLKNILRNFSCIIVVCALRIVSNLNYALAFLDLSSAVRTGLATAPSLLTFLIFCFLVLDWAGLHHYSMQPKKRSRLRKLVGAAIALAALAYVGTALGFVISLDSDAEGSDVFTRWPSIILMALSLTVGVTFGIYALRMSHVLQQVSSASARGMPAKICGACSNISASQRIEISAVSVSGAFVVQAVLAFSSLLQLEREEGAGTQQLLVIFLSYLACEFITLLTVAFLYHGKVRDVSTLFKGGFSRSELTQSQSSLKSSKLSEDGRTPIDSVEMDQIARPPSVTMEVGHSSKAQAEEFGEEIVF